MRHCVWIIVAIVFAGAGAYLVVEERPPRRDRRYRGMRHRIDDTQEQLAALAVHLRQYKKSHGRYPSTDEGLGVLDNFTTRLTVTMYGRPGDGSEGLYWFDDGPHSRGFPLYFWRTARSQIRDYRREHGHVPRTIDELQDVPLLDGVYRPTTTAPTDPQFDQVRWEVAIGHDDSVFLINDAGVLTRWQLPFVYENRNDGSAAAFVDSPADDDPERLFSTKVDEGIFVWSVDGQQLARDIGPPPLHTLSRQRYLGGALILAAAACAWLLVPRGRRHSVAASLVVSAVVGAGATMLTHVTSCYIMSFDVRSREPVLVSRRKELLDKYRAAGAISHETYATSIKAMGLSSADKAASRPGGGDGSERE